MKGLVSAFFLIVCIKTYAQKLPNVQQVSLRAPANVKIDGKANEWGKMQAYNPATEVYYTMANDDKKLYLIVQASGWPTIVNITNGGIKLTIQKSGEKQDAGAPFIKFPYMEKGKSVLIPPKGQAHRDPDTAMMQANKLLATKIKWIYTRGLPDVDTLLSIYNDHIVAANAVDIKQLYTYEMAVDLAPLGLSVENLSGFSYHIIINGEPNAYRMLSAVSFMKLVKHNGQSIELTEQQMQNLENFDNLSNKMTASTDFWGEYTLAK